MFCAGCGVKAPPTMRAPGCCATELPSTRPRTQNRILGRPEPPVPSTSHPDPFTIARSCITTKMAVDVDSLASQDMAAQYLVRLLYLSSLLIVGRIVYTRLFHPLARFPGPFIASFSNVWKTYHVAIGDYEHVLLALHRQHGKIVRVGPHHLDFSDTSAVKTIYGSGRQFKKRLVVPAHIDFIMTDPEDKFILRCIYSAATKSFRHTE